jgi:hypothetical protein
MTPIEAIALVGALLAIGGTVISVVALRAVAPILREPTIPSLLAPPTDTRDEHCPIDEARNARIEELTNKTAQLRKRANEEMIEYPELAREDLRKAAVLGSAVEKLEDGDSLNEVDTYLMKTL